MRRFEHVMIVAGIAGILAVSWTNYQATPAVGSDLSQDRSDVPTYASDGALLQPTGYTNWMVVGTSVGLSYSADHPTNSENPGMFHNVYLPRSAFEHFVKTGEFPEQTIFVVTNNPSQPTQGKDSLNRAGFFAGSPTGLEVAVKDSQRFDGGWGYFMFHQLAADDAATRPAEKAFPRQDCYDCHAEHGAIDNVFTQFYTVLTSARERANR